MARQCELVVGFLVPHRCTGKARSVCTKCGKAICDEHATVSDSGIVCVACQENIEQPTAAALPGPVYAGGDYLPFSPDEDRGDFFADMS